MSDLAPGTVSLEENALPPEVETPETPPETPPPVAQSSDEPDPEGTVVNPGGEKLVPLSALAAARQAAREAKEQVAALKPKAEKVDQIVSEWQAAQPLLERARQQTAPPPAPKGPLSEADAVEYAKDLDLYRPDGTPDVDRAQRLAARQQAIAEKQAQQYVQPLIQHTAESQSRANFEQAAAFRGDQGIQADRGILQQIWSGVPAEMSAQPHIARVLWSQAVAESLLQGKIKVGAATVPPPVVTESLGGSTTKPALSVQERRFADAAGITTKTFEEISARFKPGERNSLE